MPAAVGGTLSSQKTSMTGWLTPTGFGPAAMYAYVGILHGGVCALAVDTVEKMPAESNKIKAIAIAVSGTCVFDLFISNFFNTCFLSSYYSIVRSIFFQ
jgi:hypothetical protein